MARIEKSALVPFPAQSMFDLVNDIDRYAEFLPWCKASQVLSRDDKAVCGRLDIAKAGIHQYFTTRNRLYPPERIELELVEGPFKRLHGTWRFDPLRDDACKIVLVLEFEFSGKLVNKAFGAVFRQIADTMVDAFCKRAKELHDGG